MPNKPIADLIAATLASGLIHPGDPEDSRGEMVINLPVFRTAGLPEQVAEQVSVTTTLLAEAIVHLIETAGGSEIVDREELIRLRNLEARLDGEGTRMIPVHCRCDGGRADPLLVLTVSDRPTIAIDGAVLIGGLKRRETQCPHKVTVR
jgi:hypothetical protein